MMREVRVAHVELSLSGAFVPQARTPDESEFVSSVDRWAATVWRISGRVKPSVLPVRIRIGGWR